MCDAFCVCDMYCCCCCSLFRLLHVVPGGANRVTNPPCYDGGGGFLHATAYSSCREADEVQHKLGILLRQGLKKFSVLVP